MPTNCDCSCSSDSDSLDVAPNNPPRRRANALVEVAGNRADDNLAVANRGDGIRADERLVGIFQVGVLAVALRPAAFVPAVFALVVVRHPAVVARVDFARVVVRRPAVVVLAVVVPPRLRDVVAQLVESMALDEFQWPVDSAKNHPPHRRRAVYPAESRVCLGPDNRLAEAFLRLLKGDRLKGDRLKGDQLKGDQLKDDQLKDDPSKGDLLTGAVPRVEELDDWLTACDLATDDSSKASD